MYETFEHTADLGLSVSADSLQELFAEAAVGLTSLVVAEVGSVQQKQERILEVTSTDLEYLYFDWLSELLYLFESEGWLTSRAQVEVSERHACGTLFGERFHEARHRRSHEVKAVTYHGLNVRNSNSQGKPAWQADAIVDI